MFDTTASSAHDLTPASPLSAPLPSQLLPIHPDHNRALNPQQLPHFAAASEPITESDASPIFRQAGSVNHTAQPVSHPHTNLDLLTNQDSRASLIAHADDPLTHSQRSSRSAQRQTRNPGNSLASADIVGTLNGTQSLSDRVGRRDRNDYFQFDIANKSGFKLTLNRLQADADVQILNAAGEVIQSSVQTGRQAESIRLNLEAGSYYARVYSYNDANTRYSLNLSTNPIANAQEKDWTIMVYMAADSLEQFSLQDFQEMAAIGSNSRVNVVVQLDRTAGVDSSFGNWTDTRRGRVDANDAPGLNWGNSIGEANMGDADTLRDFVNWGITNYQADHYALINWGHGSGFDVSYDDQTGDSISARELNSVLSGISAPIDLVGADACLMSTTEFAYEISDHASVFVGSQELEPGTGWDYTKLLSDLASKPTMSAFQLGSAIVDGYAAYSDANGDSTQTLSAINLSALQTANPNGLSARLNSFASTVMSAATSFDLTRLGRYRDFFADSFGDGDFPNYCDIGNLFTSISQDRSLSGAVQTAAQAVLNAYRSAVVANYSPSGTGTGLSLYFSPRREYPEEAYNSTNLGFALDTQWDDLLNWYAW